MAIRLGFRTFRGPNRSAALHRKENGEKKNGTNQSAPCCVASVTDFTDRLERAESVGRSGRKNKKKNMEKGMAERAIRSHQ